MAYIDFADGLKGSKERKAFWLSENGLALIEGWRRNGVSLADLAKTYIGISMTAWYGWYKESEELRKACNNGTDVANAKVEGALLKRALGYDYWEETWELVEGEMILVRKLKKHLPPDTKAILCWLYNRRPEDWRSIQEPLQDTQYKDTVKNILVAMKEVAESGQAKEVTTIGGEEE